MKSRRKPVCLLSAAILGAGTMMPAGAGPLGAGAGESVAVDPAVGAASREYDWLTGSDVSLWGVLTPHMHAVGAVGGTTADSIESLALGHHDPQDTWTLQTLEVGASLRIEDWLHGFAIYTGTSDAEGDVNWEWEEAFLKLPNLPGGFEVRGGRFFNRFGFQNSVHNHSWHFVNQNLLNGRLLQEGEVITEGAELTWNLPTDFPAAVSLSYGNAFEEGGQHHHEHEEEEAEFEGEGARFVDEVLGAYFIGRFDRNDFNQHRVTLSGAWGDNEFGGTTQVYGVGYEYQWRENGYEPGGRYFIWRNELAYRHFEAVAHEEHHEEEEEEEEEEHEEHGHSADLDDIAFYTMLIYGFSEHLEVGVRGGWVGGIREAGLDERFRLSPNLTVSLNEERTLFARVQYDYDYFDGHGSEHSIWFQVGLNWGGPEVR